MDFLRPRLARHVLAVTTIGFGLAGLGGACAAQDERGAMSQAAYHGPYLSWSGKKAQAPAPDPDLAEARYAPAPNYDPGAAAPQAPRYAAPANAGPESRYGSAQSEAQPEPRHSASPSAEAYSSPRGLCAPPAPQSAAAPPPAPAPVPAPAAAPAAAARRLRRPQQRRAVARSARRRPTACGSTRCTARTA